MSESLIIKDGNGDIKSLQVDSGSNGYISNHTYVSTATNSIVSKYYTNGPSGWEWDISKGVVTIANFDSSRKSLIVSNNSTQGQCYILLGSSDFGTIDNVAAAPPIYSFLLEPKCTYFADSTSAVLEHSIYIVSSSNIPNSSSMTVCVTEVK